MKENSITARRNFLKTSSLTGLGLMGFSTATNATDFVNNEYSQSLPKDLTVLFQGDSITDAGRNRSDYYANGHSGMGNGYVYQIVAQLLGSHPKDGFSFYNRGVSGHKVFQLANRWKEDCLQIRPDVLSLLIGVNDFWHTMTHGYEGTSKIFETDLRKLLDRTKKELPNVKLIIGEPFVVANGSAVSDKRWTTEFTEYQAASKTIAKEYQAGFVPYQQIFEDALKVAPVDYWCPDGVHPSIAGCNLMAKGWLKAFESIMK